MLDFASPVNDRRCSNVLLQRFNVEIDVNTTLMYWLCVNAVRTSGEGTLQPLSTLGAHHHAVMQLLPRPPSMQSCSLLTVLTSGCQPLLGL